MSTVRRRLTGSGRRCPSTAAPGWKLVAGGGAGLEAGSRRREEAPCSGQLVRSCEREPAPVRIANIICKIIYDIMESKL
jgi:hypothetical protein